MKRLALFLFFVLMAGEAKAVITVCASGCNDTTFVNAIATATATPNSQIENLDKLHQESVTLGLVNTSLSFFSPDTSYVWLSAPGTVALTFGSCASPVTVSSMSISATGAGSRCLSDPSAISGFSFFGSGLNLNTTNPGASPNQFAGVYTVAKQIVIEKSYISTLGGTCFFASGISTGVGSILLDRDIFVVKGGVNYALNFASSGSSSSAIVDVYNCLVYGNAGGAGSGAVTSAQGMDVKNTLFFNNTLQFGLTGGASGSNFTYDGFDAAPSAGTSCIYNLSKSSEFCDPTNFWLSPASQTRGKGTAITGVTDQPGLNNVVLNGDGADMGPNGYSPAFCGGQGVGGR